MHEILPEIRGLAVLQNIYQKLKLNLTSVFLSFFFYFHFFVMIYMLSILHLKLAYKSIF